MSSDPSERDLLAAEVALRLLDGRELDEARALAARDPAFAREIADWDERFAPLFDGIAPVEPGAEVWQRIATAIERRKGDGDEVVALRRRVRVWSGTAMAAMAIAAALAITVLPGIIRPERAPTPAPAPAAISAPTLLAKVVAEDRTTAYVATYEPERQEMLVTPALANIPQGRSHELWVIGASGVPVSLGVIDEQKPTRIKLAAAALRDMRPDATIAVTVEPAGGSPTGQPTTTPIAAGALATI